MEHPASSTAPEPGPDPVGSGGGVPGDLSSGLILLSRPGCHLCDAARDVVREVTLATGAAWREIGIDDDRALAAKYGEDIPVVLINGVQHAFWRVDAARLRTALVEAGIV